MNAAAFASIASLCIAVGQIDRHDPIATTEKSGLPNVAMSFDWPHVRGPSYDGVSLETGLAEQWPSDGAPILWRAELGKGYAGITAVGDRIYTQIQTVVGQYLVCLDADTGSEIWRQRYDWPWDGAGMYPGPYATPTIDSGRVYFASPSGLVGCMDAAYGKAIWSVNVTKKYGGKGTEFGFASTPLVEDGKVIVPVGGINASVVALNTFDGSEVWAAGSEPASYCAALPVTLNGTRAVICFLQNSAVAHELTTGRLLWRYDTSRGYDEHAAWPLFDYPFLMLSSPFKAGSQLLRIDPERGQTPKPVWDNANLSNDVCSSVLYSGNVYGFDLRDLQARAHRPSKGTFKCLDFATGATRWVTDRVGHASVIVADGKLLLFNDTGWLILARVDSQAYEELGRTKVFSGGICWTAPSLHGGRVYVRSHEQFACVYVGTPDTLDRPANTNGTMRSSQLAGWDFTWLLGCEPDFPFVAPRASELRLWFGVSLASIAIAALLSIVVCLAQRVITKRSGQFVGRILFWTTVFLLGWVGTTIVGRWRAEFILTWPVSLFVAFQMTIVVALRSQSQSSAWWRWISRLVGIGFVALCFGYYELCKGLSVPMAWGFLTGFILASPIVVPMSWWIRRRQSLASDFALALFGFSAFFWSSAAFMAWRMNLK